MLPNGPESGVHRGAEFGFRGEATLLPWDYRVERDEPQEVEVAFRVRTVRLPLLLERVVRVRSGSAKVEVAERITDFVRLEELSRPYLLALEPACDLPSLAKAAARGTALTLDPGASIETTLEATLFESPLEVAGVGAGGRLR